MKAAPSLKRILSNDHWAMTLVIVPLVLWFVALLVWLMDPGAPALGVFAAIGGVATVVLWPLAWWRVKRIHRFFCRGVQTQGTVVMAWSDRGNTTLTFRYEWEGLDYERERVVSESMVTTTMNPGDPVEVIVDPGKPSRAHVLDAYRA